MILEKKRLGVQPTFHNTTFFLHFPNELSYGYLRFEGNGKIPLGRVGGQIFQETNRCAESLFGVFRKFPLKLDSNPILFVDMKS